MRQGFTLIEIVMVLAVIGIVASLGAPHISRYVDWLAVRRAETEAAAFYSRVRITAVHRAVRMRISFSDDSLLAIAVGAVDSVARCVRGPARHGVLLETSRPEIMLYPNGLGLGAANTKLKFRRGEAVDSFTISRLGRLRRY